MADEGKRSFLIDWELATMFGKSNHDGSSRPKTMPFIALVLFHNKYLEGKIHRQYHHDLEGFLWIVPFACLRYEHSDLIERPPIRNLWNTGDYSSSRASKRDFLAMLQRVPLQAPWAIRPYRREWLVSHPFIQRILNGWRVQSPATPREERGVFRKEQAEADPKTTVLVLRDTYADFWATIKGMQMSSLEECVSDGF